MKITVQDYTRIQTKLRKANSGHGWTKLERIEMDCIWVNLKNVGPPFFKFMSVYIKISFTQRENHSQLLFYLNETSTEEHTVPYNRLLVKLAHSMDDDLTGTMLQCKCNSRSGAQRIKLTTRYAFGQPA